MDNKQFVIFVFIVFLAFQSPCHAQIALDSIMSVSEEDSIVYIDEPAVVIQKTIIEEEVIYENWFLEGSIGSIMHVNRHLICEQCLDYRNEMIQSIRPVFGKNIGLKLFYAANNSNMIYSFGVSTASFREQFNHDSSNQKSLNKYNYVDMSIGTGYWINRKKKFAFILNVDLLYSRLISKEGLTLDYVDSDKVLTLEEANRDAQDLLSGRGCIKVLFFNHKRVKFFIEPNTRANFSSVLGYKENYYWRRWTNGIGIGFLFVL